MRFGIGCEA